MKTHSVYRSAIGATFFSVAVVFGLAGHLDPASLMDSSAVAQSENDQMDLASRAPDSWLTGKAEFVSTEQSCTSKNLVWNKPHVQEVRNQRATGWCYANAVADSLSYDEGVRISAASVAEAKIRGRREFFKRDSDQKTYDFSEDGSRTYLGPIAAVWDMGYCLESEVRDPALMNFIALIKHKPEFQELAKNLGIIPSQDYRSNEAKKSEELRSKEISTLESALVRAGYERELASELIEKMVSIQTQSPLRTYMDILCPKRHTIRGAPFNPGVTRYRNLIQPLKYLVQPFAFSVQWQYPVQFSFGVPTTVKPANEFRFLDEGHRALNYNRPFLMSHDVGPILKSDKIGAIHASIVVGRRWNKSANNGQGRCEFLVKNSWGKANDNYNTNKVTPLNGEAFGPGRGDYTGYYWLPENSFLEIMKYPTDLEFKRAKRENRPPEKKWLGKVFWYLNAKAKD